MKKKLSFPTIVGILTLVIVIVAFKSPLFDSVAMSKEWGEVSIEWAYMPIIHVTFWIMGVGMCIFASGKGGFRVKWPFLVAGVLITLWASLYIVDWAMFFLADAKIDIFPARYDFLHIFWPHRKYSYELYFTYVFDVIGGYLLTYGLYGKKKPAPTGSKGDDMP